jgi:hypothetical protein
MRSASECAPKTCKVCNRRLEKPRHDFPWIDEKLTKFFGWSWCDRNAPITEEVWHIKCRCHIVYVWSWHEKSNGCWKLRSDLPLADTKEVVVLDTGA